MPRNNIFWVQVEIFTLAPLLVLLTNIRYGAIKLDFCLCALSRGERERLFGSREREGKLKIPFPFYVGVNDTPVFLLNEYIVELNPANINILNQILN